MLCYVVLFVSVAAVPGHALGVWCLEPPAEVQRRQVYYLLVYLQS